MPRETTFTRLPSDTRNGSILRAVAMAHESRVSYKEWNILSFLDMLGAMKPLRTGKAS